MPHGRVCLSPHPDGMGPGRVAGGAACHGGRGLPSDEVTRELRQKGEDSSAQ